MPDINDTIRLLITIPEDDLQKGRLGVIVEKFSEPDEAYEVEFSAGDGTTFRQVALRPNQFVVVQSMGYDK